MADFRKNQEWIHDLSSRGEAQEAAIADLRNILLRAALFFFSRNQGDLAGLSHEEILQRAEDCAQEALIAVLEHLQDFRGDSKFTTWAYKFAINKALMAARQERWKGISLDNLSEEGETSLSEWLTQGSSGEDSPEQFSIQTEVVGIIQQVIENELSERQRQVLTLMIIDEVPMDEVVQYLGTNRNAVYKMLHDARLKVRNGLLKHGLEVGEALAMFTQVR